jgi:hypothetical protein
MYRPFEDDELVVALKAGSFSDRALQTTKWPRFPCFVVSGSGVFAQVSAGARKKSTCPVSPSVVD